MVEEFLELTKEFLQFTDATFTEATAVSSLRKAEKEIEEVEADLTNPDASDHMRAIEYADVMFCIIHSAHLAGISPKALLDAMYVKLRVVKARKWEKNPDNTYSHIKQ